MHELAAWDSFYVILGSAAGALVGLQFVVMTLISERPLSRPAEVSAAFATPTINYFSAVLLLCALIRVPWTAHWQLRAATGSVGVLGVIYVAVVFRRVLTQQTYSPQAEDWLFHVTLPFIAFAGIAAAAAILPSSFQGSAFCFAGGALLLLFVAIHNAWDAVVYHVTVRKHAGK